MPEETKPAVVTDAELLKRLHEMHEWTQAQREAISEEEPGWDHDKHDLWKHLLDVEYYCLEAAGEIESLPSTACPKCPMCKGNGMVDLPSSYPPKRREYTTAECKNCNGTGRLEPWKESQPK